MIDSTYHTADYMSVVDVPPPGRIQPPSEETQRVVELGERGSSLINCNTCMKTTTTVVKEEKRSRYSCLLSCFGLFTHCCPGNRLYVKVHYCSKCGQKIGESGSKHVNKERIVH